MKVSSSRELLTWVLRIGVGGLFIWAGIVKMLNFQAFADSIATFKLLPLVLVNIVTLWIPSFELLIGACLIIGWHARAAAIGVTSLSSLFLLVLVQAIARGQQIDCGCFGEGDPWEASGWLLIIRDSVLLGVSLILYKGLSSNCIR